MKVEGTPAGTYLCQVK